MAAERKKQLQGFAVLLVIVFGVAVYFSQKEKAEGKAPAAASKELTLEKYNQLRFGMNYDQVVGVLGFEGVEQASSKLGNVIHATYYWQGSFMQGVTITFENNQVASLSQAGLK